jgi:hypothetical protein
MYYSRKSRCSCSEKQIENLMRYRLVETHGRVGGCYAAAGGAGGKRRSLRGLGKAPKVGREEEGCLYPTMPADLVKRVVEACE